MRFEFTVDQVTQLKATRGELCSAVWHDPKPVVRYILISHPGHSFQIVANNEGVIILGATPTLTSQEQLDELQRVIQWAYRQHKSLQATGKNIDQDILTAELLG